MTKKTKMCTHVGRWQPWYTLFPDKMEPDTGYQDEGMTGLGIKKRKVTCPVCKRRVGAQMRAGHDGDVYWRVPRHKRRGWWKRPKLCRREKKRR